MNDLTPSPSPSAQQERTFAAPLPGHLLGPVADDWAAIEVWLDAVADNSRSRTNETIKTYRFHLAKLRWYCERELGRPPSTWSAQDVKAFRSFLAELPASGLCASGATPGEAGYTPFRKTPGASSQADVLRFTHAMFSALHGAGYLRLNPMVLMKTSKPRRLDKTRAVDTDLYDLVLQVIAGSPNQSQLRHQLKVRDIFIFICLRESGLRASELVGARMRAVRPLSDPKNGKTYWVLTVDAATAKGGRERSVPVTTTLLDAFTAYRAAFGLPPLPGPNDRDVGLILSVRTKALALGRHGSTIKSAADRRFFGAWRSVDTRFGLHGIVKGRIREAVAVLVQAGDHAGAAHLERVSAHWMRHTFALASLLAGQDIRTVATSLGHASVATTMVYTEQDTLDQIRSWENERPGSVAQVPPRN
jgi:integrase/recombinase XerC